MKAALRLLALVLTLALMCIAGGAARAQSVDEGSGAPDDTAAADAVKRLSNRDAVVRALDSSRSAQAQSYLVNLDSPEPLYIFLEPASGKLKVRLLEVLARIGNAETVERIKPYAASVDPQVASAAQSSIREINTRLAQAPPETQTRPRRVGNEAETA